MLEREELDAVLLCTPPAVRLEPVQLACEKKLAVFCEKPPAFDTKTARKIEEIIRRAGIINSVGFHYRFLDVVDRAVKLLAGRKIVFVDSIFVCGTGLDPNQPKWSFIQETASGPLMEQAIHSLDTMRYLCGEIRTVSVLAGNPVLPKSDELTIEDTHALSLQFESGAMGVHMHSWVYRGEAVKIRMFGVDFNLTVDLVPPYGLYGTLDGEKVEFLAPDDDCYLTQMAQFVKAVQRQDQSIVRSSYTDAAKTLEVTLSAIKAVYSGRAEQVSTGGS